jgi:hypothetical protein
VKRTLALVLGLVLAAVAGSALADTATLSWTNATQNTDNTAIPAPPAAGSLTRTTIEYGTCNAGRTGITGTVGTMFVAYPTATLDVAMVVVQEYCFDAFHTNTFGTTSAKSSVVWKANPPPTPKPPANLATQTAQTAYTLQFSLDRMARLGVGTVPPGTQCDTSTSVTADWQLTGVASPLYKVPRAAVVWAGNVKPQAVFASCG